MARPKGSKNKVITPVRQPTVQPTVVTHPEEATNEVKIIQCPYMGPDADDAELFVRQNLVGNQRWTSDDTDVNNFSIAIDSTY
jgi:hypothetical protein